MTEQCPYIEECEETITKKYYELFCVTGDVGYEHCLPYKRRHPELKKTPAEWFKEEQG